MVARAMPWLRCGAGLKELPGPYQRLFQAAAHWVEAIEGNVLTPRGPNTLTALCLIIDLLVEAGQPRRQVADFLDLSLEAVDWAVDAATEWRQDITKRRRVNRLRKRIATSAMRLRVGKKLRRRNGHAGRPFMPEALAAA